ncbi:HhH-GDP family DNA glycosylase [Salinactinospora qingdaonensis]|uniref:Endonuclease III n=1 Tax=Salinactinospora qingdaonensis TaxID=702744 RepID=A0ABP7FEB4_9ACTN
MATQQMTYERIAQVVLAETGTTLAKRAGLRLTDEPAPLWQLLVLTNLVSARISTDIAIDAARELNEAGGDTPEGMAQLTWQQRVDALGRGHYVRYDESTASRLGGCARIALDDYGGDLRNLAEESGRHYRKLEHRLQRFPGIGPTGAAIFCREAQAVWPWLRPFSDKLVSQGAERLGLPTQTEQLAHLVAPEDFAALAAGLVGVARDNAALQQVRQAAGGR